MPPFKDEHILVIAPGSSITQTQLGLPETFTPPRWRFPTRMFPGLKDGEYEPVYIRERKKAKPDTTQAKPENGTNGADSSLQSAANGDIKDTEMSDAHPTTNGDAPEPVKAEDSTNGVMPTTETAEGQPQIESLPTDSTSAIQPAESEAVGVDGETTGEDETEFVDDPYTTRHALHPMLAGKIISPPILLSLLTHIHSLISPPFHTPVLLLSQPSWTSRDKEVLTQYIFESWKSPALCIMDSALATCWGYGVGTACVVDIGEGKCDVSAVVEYSVVEVGRATAVEGCGGRGLTQRLCEEMKRVKNESSNDADGKTGRYAAFTDEELWDVAEQLKKSPICEILGPGVPLPTKTAPPAAPAAPVPAKPIDAAPAPAASAPTTDAAASVTTENKEAAPATTEPPADHPQPNPAEAVPIAATNVEPDSNDIDDDDAAEGVLDVAAIVSQNNAAELIAKREREKAEKEAKRKAALAQGEAPKPIRLRNAEKMLATFTYEDWLEPEAGTAPTNTSSRKRKREVEVGLERFMCATPSTNSTESVLDRIASAVHSTIMAVPDISSRSQLWENIIVVGNGSRIRGFTPALLHTLQSRYVLQPSNSTIFTSELPSNFSTPVPTGGTNTPIPGQPSHPSSHISGSGVNPLLVAATKNMMQPMGMQHLHQQHLGVPPNMHAPHHYQPNPNVYDPHHQGQMALPPFMPQPTYRSPTQTPSSIKLVKPPEYFPEWKDAGYEDAQFLGAQVAAKVVFIVDQGASKGFLTRSEYNELGPEGVHSCCL